MFGLLNKEGNRPGVSSIMDRSEVFMTNLAVWKVSYLSTGLGDTNDGIIVPGQSQSKEKKEVKKEFMLC